MTRIKEKELLDRYGDPLPEEAIGRIGTLRLRHSIQGGNGWIGSAHFSPDGSLLAVAAKEDSRISLWEIPSGRLRFLFDARDHGYVLSAHFSPDGRWLISQGHGDPWKTSSALWDISTGIRQDWLPENAGCFSQFSPDSRLLATAAQDGIVVWDIPSRRSLCRLIPVAGLPEFSADGTLLAGANNEGVVLWRMPSAEPLRSFAFPEKDDWRTTWCQALALSDDGRWLAVARHASKVVEVLTEAEFKRRKNRTRRRESREYADGQVRLIQRTTDITVWETATGEVVSHIKSASAPQRLVFLPESAVLLSTHPHKTQRGPDYLRAWAIPSGKRKWTVKVDFHREFALDSEGRRVASINKGVQVHDTMIGRLLEKNPVLPTLRGLNKLSFSPTQPNLLAIAHHDGLIELRDTETGEEINPLLRHNDAIREIAFSSDGACLATQSYGMAILWEADTGRQLARMDVPFGDHNLVGTNNRLAVFAPTPTTRTIWDWTTSKPWPILPETFEGEAILWAKGDLVAVQKRQGSKTRLYSTLSGEVVGELPRMVVAISHGGGLFAVAQREDCLRFWRLEPLREVGQIDIPFVAAQGEHYFDYTRSLSQSFAFSPDDATLACRVSHKENYPRKGIFLWDVASGQLLSQAHFNPMEEAGFGANSNLGFRVNGRPLLAIPTYSSREDGEYFSVTLWDGTTGQRLHDCAQGRDYIESLAFAPAGRALAITRDTTVLLWKL